MPPALHLDSNILIALLRDEATAPAITDTLDQFAEADLVIHIGVYAELLAAPSLTQSQLDMTLREFGIAIQAHTSTEE